MHKSNTWVRLVAISISIILVAFSNSPRATHLLHFVGNVFLQTEVADETLWWELSPVTCTPYQEVACSLIVPDDTYVISSGGITYLNIARIDLDGVIGYSSLGIDQFKPVKIGGNGITPTFINSFHH